MDSQRFQFYPVIIVGSGAAGLACANGLIQRGMDPTQICVLTENLRGGTSFNAGSDKQTYYRLALVGNELEAPERLAQTLFEGGCMHGDIALIEATCSIQAFYNLVHLGIPFPHNQFGTYIGYKTDNDPLSRGTSIGPLTSKMMVSGLLTEIQSKGTPIFDSHYVLGVHTSQNTPKIEISTFDFSNLNLHDEFDEQNLTHNLKLLTCQFLVLAVGGPALMYLNCAYPLSHNGSTGLAINAGLWLQNLTESQYGIASLKVPWNLSGSYQQVIPRYISFAVDVSNNPIGDPVEFLKPYFSDISALISATFFKGYQWPFNPKYLINYGSSIIDLAIYQERLVSHRRVFIDYRYNPSGFTMDTLPSITSEYLRQSNALLNTPFERLQAMNPQAVQFYRDHGIDLGSEPLEVAICAQHSNGGVVGDIWWQTSHPHIFAIGEINGSHGVSRPGGAALNAGQVGAIRAAEKIIYERNKLPTTFTPSRNSSIFAPLITEFLSLRHKDVKHAQQSLLDQTHKMQARMMENGAYIRSTEMINLALKSTQEQLTTLGTTVRLHAIQDVLTYCRLKNALVTQYTYLYAIRNYLERGGGSRGSYLILSSSVKNQKIPKFGDLGLPSSHFLYDWNIIPPDPALHHQIQMIRLVNPNTLEFQVEWLSVRPIPEQSTWFEAVWRDFTTGKIYEDTDYPQRYFPDVRK